MRTSITDAVMIAIQTVLRDTGRHPKTLSPSHSLTNDLGFDSLDLAQTIVLLEHSLGVDPFRKASGERLTVRTVADLISVYEEPAPQV